MVKLKQLILFAIIMVIFLSSLIFATGLLTDLELISYDYRLLIKNFLTDRLSEEIVIISIDEASLSKYGEWPWSRIKHAELIEFLNQAGAEVIAFDIIFDMEKESEADEKLADKLAKYDNVVLPASLDLTMIRRLQGDELKVEGINYPLELFKSETELGYINLIPDSDGKIRRLNLLDDLTLQPFAIKIADLAKEEFESFKFDKQEKFINYYSQDAYPKFSYYQVLENKVSPEFFEDKIVLVGAEDDSFKDYWITPLSSVEGYTPGVIIHAQILENYLTESFIYQIEKKIIIFLMIMFGTATFYLFYKFKPLKGLGLMLALFLAIIILALILLIKFNLFFLIMPFIFILIFNYLSSNILWYFKLDKQRKRLYDLFSRYLAPEIVKEVVDSSDLNDFSGQRALLTVLFVDLVGFTNYAEENSPEVVVKTLNRYFSLITEEVFKQEGTLDKFIGDGAMVFFGAPIDCLNQAEKAVQLALSLQKEINMGQDFPLAVSIGINTGSAIVGNLGSAKRIEYTAVGDTVNVAARIESKAKAGEILVGEKTYQSIKNDYNFEQLGKVKLKGKTKQVKVYKLSGY